MSLKHTQAVIRKVKMEVNMKNSLPILVMLALLVALPATAAWSQSNDSKQCMETCLEPAIKSGDEDVIKQAVKQCKAQCTPESPGVFAARLRRQRHVDQIHRRVLRNLPSHV